MGINLKHCGFINPIDFTSVTLTAIDFKLSTQNNKISTPNDSRRCDRHEVKIATEIYAGYGDNRRKIKCNFSAGVC